MDTKPQERIARDLWLVVLSVAAAVYAARSGLITAFVESAAASDVLASFIAGMFFTSLFTVAPAGVALGELALSSAVLPVAFWGAIGAVVGDLVLFSFVKNTLFEDIQALARPWRQVWTRTLHSPLLQWVAPIVGGLIIASPLPDEFGLALLGVSHIRLALFVPIAFIGNFAGILLLGLAAASLSS